MSPPRRFNFVKEKEQQKKNENKTPENNEQAIKLKGKTLLHLQQISTLVATIKRSKVIKIEFENVSTTIVFGMLILMEQRSAVMAVIVTCTKIRVDANKFAYFLFR